MFQSRGGLETFLGDPYNKNPFGALQMRLVVLKLPFRFQLLGLSDTVTLHARLDLKPASRYGITLQEK